MLELMNTLDRHLRSSEDNDHLDAWMLDIHELKEGGWTEQARSVVECAKVAAKISKRTINRRWNKPGYSRFRPLPPHATWTSLEDIDADREMAAIQALSSTPTSMAAHRPQPPTPSQPPAHPAPRRLSPKEEAMDEEIDAYLDVCWAAADKPRRRSPTPTTFLPAGKADGACRKSTSGAAAAAKLPQVLALPDVVPAASKSHAIRPRRAVGSMVQALSHHFEALSTGKELASLVRGPPASSRTHTAVTVSTTIQVTRATPRPHLPAARRSSHVASLVHYFELRAC